MSIDKHNSNNKISEFNKLEIDQEHNHDTYKDMEKGSSLEGHKLIRIHFIFDVKHDVSHEARLACDEHLTEVPLSSVY